jgi:transcriptional regulator with XRE-family HTH domain
MSGIGTRIMKRRKEMKLTQEELAARLGYKAKSTINKIELGINDIPQSKVVKFAEALNTTPAYLMGWQEEIKKDPVGAAERHVEMIMDEDLSEMFEDFKTLNDKKRKIVKDLVKSLAETEA